MTLADFTSPNLILPHLGGRDVPSVLKELTLALHREDRVPDVLPFYHAILNREYLASTEVDDGLALPHARLPGVRDISFAFGRTDTPISWRAGGGDTVKMVFLIAVPATEPAQYLLLIAGIVELTRDVRLFEQLRTGRKPDQLMEIFRRIPLKRHPTAGPLRYAVGS